MVIPVSLIYLYQLMINPRPLLLALSVLLLIDVCLLDYVMHLLPFQRCMLAIFSDFCEKICEVFMDDFSDYGSSFDDFLSNLALVCRDVKKLTLS